MQIIRREGVNNFGYYPDDFLSNQPDPAVLKPVFSVQTQPRAVQLPSAPTGSAAQTGVTR
ncbi:hypothetical protein ACEUC3_10285 [Aeromonas bivalvium]